MFPWQLRKFPKKVYYHSCPLIAMDFLYIPELCSSSEKGWPWLLYSTHRQCRRPFLQQQTRHSKCVEEMHKRLPTVRKEAQFLFRLEFSDFFPFGRLEFLCYENVLCWKTGQVFIRLRIPVGFWQLLVFRGQSSLGVTSAWKDNRLGTETVPANYWKTTVRLT